MARPTSAADAPPGSSGWRWVAIAAIAAIVGIVLVVVSVLRFLERTAPAVRDTVESAGQAAREVGRAATKARESLQPFTATRDPDVVDAWLKDAFRVAPPPGYVGAFGVRTQLLGRQLTQVTAAIPKGAKSEEIFHGGPGGVRFSPGPHTILIAARFHDASREQAEQAFAEMEQSDRRQPGERVFVEAGGKRVAALRGGFERHGQRNTFVAVFLDGGRVFYAAGPRDAFDERALAQALASLVRAHPTDDLLYAHPAAPPRRVVDASDPCGIPGVTGDFDVVAISIPRGSVESDVLIDASGERAGLEDVVVGATPRPIVLLLMGDAPVVWKVGRTPGARVAGVLAQGRNRQAVTGLPESIPVTAYSGLDGRNACPHFRAIDRAKAAWDERGKADARVRELFGRGIDLLITTKANQRFLVGVPDGPVVHGGDLDIRRFALPADVMPAGLPGLEWLLARGALRIAKPDELEAWRRGFEARTGRTLDARELRPLVGDAYVMPAPTRVPYLAGAHSRLFIVPAKVPLPPAGDRGHSSFLMMDGFHCSGTLPACRL